MFGNYIKVIQRETNLIGLNLRQRTLSLRSTSVTQRDFNYPFKCDKVGSRVTLLPSKFLNDLPQISSRHTRSISSSETFPLHSGVSRY